MGNCLQPSKISSQVHDEPQHNQLEVISNDVQEKPSSGETKEGTKKSSVDHNIDDEGTKVKIVLTKEELEWLMYELKVKHNKLEDALAEIQRNRALKSSNCWQPSLESISEDDLDE
ncbi:hypothetical protein LINGRAHAP2_LOCUS25485 [Linum grandiflorum]